MADEEIDLVRQFPDAGERAASNGRLSDDAEPALDLVESRGIVGGVVDVVISRSPCEPGSDLRVLVGGVVVGDEVNIEGFGEVGVDVALEGEELLVAMALLALGDELSGGDVEGGEQGGGAVTDVILGDPFDVAQPHRQHRLDVVECLDLGFLVDTQHDGVVGRVEIEADDIAHLLDEEGVVGELEVALAVGLDGEQTKPPLHGALGDAGLLGHGAHAPMGGPIGWIGLEGGVDDLGDSFIVMGSGSARAQFIVQRLDPLQAIELPSLADGGIVQAHALEDRGVRLALGAGENDVRTPHHPMRQGARVGDAEELEFLVVCENNGFDGANHGAWANS